MPLAWLTQPSKSADRTQLQIALARQAQLTKPPGSLGALEDIAVRLASLQGCERPALDRVRIAVFAGDHGVAEEGVSAFPQSVTVEMVRNFARGGAAINVLARSLGASLEVVNVGTVTDPGELPGVLQHRIAPGTANFCRAPAMTQGQLAQALAAGKAAAERARVDDIQMFIGGEMGIGNTTAASALAAALLRQPAAELVGRGTGLDDPGVRRKARVVEQALALHAAELRDAVAILRCLGGLEIAALTGAYLRCAQLGIPVLVDGFISSVAALQATHILPAASTWFFYAHQSAEAGHARILSHLRARPLLHLDMRLGEASGAAVALPLLRLAVALHNNMASFSEAGVSGATERVSTEAL
jgi:nicotinate-nucleotide--dimethylbenzimidazole phosphoribosyltransferase